jgi:hypothetical protein
MSESDAPNPATEVSRIAGSAAPGHVTCPEFFKHGRCCPFGLDRLMVTRRLSNSLAGADERLLDAGRGWVARQLLAE